MRGFNKSWPSECKSNQIKIKNKPAWVKYVCPSSPLLWYIARVVAYYVATAVCGSDTNSHYCSGNYIYIAIVVLHIHTWPCLSKWVTFSLQLIFKGSFHFLDFGFSAKSDCPVFVCVCVCVCVCVHWKLYSLCTIFFINVIKRCFKLHSLVDKDCGMKVVVATSNCYNNMTIVFASFKENFVLTTVI